MPAHDTDCPRTPVIAVGPRTHAAVTCVPDWCERFDGPDLRAGSRALGALSIVLVHADDEDHFVACSQACSTLRAGGAHPLVVALAARHDDPRPSDRRWLRQLAVTWDAIVVTTPLDSASAHERVARAWTEALFHRGLIGIDFADVCLAPRIGHGALFEWSVAIPVLPGELDPPDVVRRYLQVHPTTFGQFTMRFVPNATLAELNELALAVAEFVPANANILWAAPSRDDEVVAERMEVALLVVETQE